MSNKQRGLLAIIILITATIMISACTYSLSTPPAATPTGLARDRPRVDRRA